MAEFSAAKKQWMRRRGKSAKAYDTMKAARDAAIAARAKAKAMTVREGQAARRAAVLPMIGRDLDDGATQRRLTKASEKFLHLLYAEAIAAIRKSPNGQVQQF
jgi:hypothetical protein